MTFGERLQRQLDISEISQKELAEYLNISYAAVNKYCKDKALPPLDTIMKIAGKLGVSIQYLVSGIEADDLPLLSDLAEELKDPLNLRIFTKLMEVDKEKRKIIYENLDNMLELVKNKKPPAK